MKHFLTMITILFTLIAFWVGALFVLSSFVRADEVMMQATVEETEINKCVEILKEAGYIKN